MKKYIFILFLFLNLGKGESQTATKIDSSNYYNFLDTHKSIYWLDREDVTEIILTELKDNGYFENDTYVLMETDSSNFVILSVYCRDLNVGFLYPRVHDYPPKREHRLMRSSYSTATGYDYIQKVQIYPNSSSVIKIRHLPDNVIILNEDCYWYQPDNNQGVSKTTITKILKEDIKNQLKKFELIKKK